MKRMNKKFTLIELLVVISLIAVLLSILLPTLGKARKVTKMAVCASNNRQLHSSFMFYAKNNNSNLPPGGRHLNNTTWNANVSWDDRTAEYMGRNLTTAEINEPNLPFEPNSLLTCPEDTTHLRNGTYLIRSYNTNSYSQWARRWDLIRRNSKGVIGILVSRQLSQIETITKTYLLTEGWQGYAGKDWYSAIANNNNIDTIANYSLHYNQSRNHLFTDGHVAFKKNSDLHANSAMLDTQE
jgi:prepilin-type N-terminal cleavage/methylation domain-containing protein